MSDRSTPSAKVQERNTLAAAIVRHAPRGDVRVAEALAAVALHRRARAERLWNGAFAASLPPLDDMFAALPEQPIGTRADAAWTAICRRIAARAIVGAGPDPAEGGHCVQPAAAPPPIDAPILTARVGPFAFYRDE